MINIHMIAPFHTIPSEAYSHCAFTGKVLRFPSMLARANSDYRVIEYSNEGSESSADAHVVMLTKPEFVRLYGERDPNAFVGNKATIGSVGHSLFEARLLSELWRRCKPGDIVAHPFGKAHASIVSSLPHVIHVETGIGYEDEPITSYRIFESNTWRHWHLGAHRAHRLTNKLTSFVVPNYYDENYWKPLELRAAPEDRYIAYLARRDSAKGIFEWREIVKAWHKRNPDRMDLRFAIAGQGSDSEVWKDTVKQLDECGASIRVIDYGVLDGPSRVKFFADALAILCPTQFTEPFGGASIEAMFCGVPAIASAWGAYTEHVHSREVFLGYTCTTLGDYMRAIRVVSDNPAFFVRNELRRAAIARFGYDTVARQYVEAFAKVTLLHQKGWNDL